MDASVAAAADAAAESHTLPEKEGRARCCELISALRAQGTGEIEADPKRVQMVNGERLRKLLQSLRSVLAGSEAKLRPAALRVLRYLCCSDEAVVLLREEYLDLFIARSLEREPSQMEERAAALRLFDRLVALQPKPLAVFVDKSPNSVESIEGPPKVCRPYLGIQAVFGQIAQTVE